MTTRSSYNTTSCVAYLLMMVNYFKYWKQNLRSFLCWVCLLISWRSVLQLLQKHRTG